MSITEGSVVVGYEIISPKPEDFEDPVVKSEDALAVWIEAVEDPEEDVYQELDGLSPSILDETEILIAAPASDADGDEILGWFSIEGTRVDLDDFFLFAQNFGKLVTTAELDMYDIAGPSQGLPDGRIDFNDFFRFADDYGKTVVNAAQIQEYLFDE